MNLLGYLLLGVVYVSLAQADCPADIKARFQCVKGEYKKLADEFATDEKMAKNKQDVSQCFTSNSCAPPNFTADPFADVPFLQTIAQRFQSLTDEQKQCLADKMRQAIQTKIVACMGSALPDWAKDAWEDNKPPAQNATPAQKAQFKQMISTVVNTLAALRNCTKPEPVGTCLNNLKAQFASKRCNAEKNCPSLVADCQAQVDQIQSKACECVEKAKADMQEKFEGGPQAGFAAITQFQQRSQEMAQVLNSCGIDSNAMINGIRNDLTTAITARCNSQNSPGARGAPGPFAIFQCLQQLRNQEGPSISSGMQRLRDFMNAHGGEMKPFFCQSCA